MRFQLAFPFAASVFAGQIPLNDPNNADLSTYQIFESDYSTNHAVRIRKQDDWICDARSSQYTGWLDVGTKHLFFWYFESRISADEDPLVLWLTGGPGGSSMIGMMGELGPCLINDHGNGTIHNPYGWSKNANMLFVDQPAGVGFSYLDEDEVIPGNSFLAAEDMHIFLQIFTTKAFPQMRNRPFHISGESYGGHYIPTLGAQIVVQNGLYPKRTQINLKSVLMGNGYVSPLDIAFGYWETLCTTKPGVKKPVFNSTRCDIMATNLPRSMELGRVCYNNPDPAICAAASTVIWDGVIKYYDSESYRGGRNRFDITRTCEVDDLCYASMIRIEEYLNKKKVWKALGVPEAVGHYNISSVAVEQAFQLGSDLSVSMEPQVLYLLTKGINVLMYQGMLDLACNTAGNLRWASSMPWKGQAEFASKDLVDWLSDGKVAGQYKEVNIEIPGVGHATRFAFLTIAGAGHMAPLDKPEASLDMMIRWIQAKDFS